MQNIFKEVKTKLQFEKKSNINFYAHVHEDIEVIFVKRGSVTAFCDGQKYLLESNTFFLTAPYQVHHYTDCTDGEYIVLVIKASKLLRFGDVFSGGVAKIAAVSPGNDSGASTVLETALNEYLTDGFSGIIEGYLTVFFGKLAKLYEFRQGNSSNDTARQILQYCIEHYRENITVSEVAAELKVSRSCVSHIFSSRFGINFCDYINSLRLFDAVELLKNRALSVTDIALISGFSNLRTFNRAFLKQYGISPTAYRSTIYYKK